MGMVFRFQAVKKVSGQFQDHLAAKGPMLNTTQKALQNYAHLYR